MTTEQEARAPLVTAHREMIGAMLAKRTGELDAMLDDNYTLTHITGYRQAKREWLAAVDSGEMRYHAADERSVTVTVTNETAVLVGRSVVDATIWGSRGKWNLQLTTDYARREGRWIAMRTVATTF